VSKHSILVTEFHPQQSQIVLTACEPKLFNSQVTNVNANIPVSISVTSNSGVCDISHLYSNFANACTVKTQNSPLEVTKDK